MTRQAHVTTLVGRRIEIPCYVVQFPKTPRNAPSPSYQVMNLNADQCDTTSFRWVCHAIFHTLVYPSFHSTRRDQRKLSYLATWALVRILNLSFNLSVNLAACGLSAAVVS